MASFAMRTTDEEQATWRDACLLVAAVNGQERPYKKSQLVRLAIAIVYGQAIDTLARSGDLQRVRETYGE
jgi:hypothetical protein